jgi:hypothetical protein
VIDAVLHEEREAEEEHDQAHANDRVAAEEPRDDGIRLRRFGRWQVIPA